MTTAEGTTLPGIDAGMCVHALAPFARCDACVTACPRQAILLDDDGLSLDPSACDGCGLCVPACPRDAITLQRPLTILFAGRMRGSAWAACREASGFADSPFACRHALGHRDLDSLAEEGVRELHILCGDCTTCSCQTGLQRLEDEHDRHTLVRKSRGGMPVRIVTYTDPKAYDRALSIARNEAEIIDRQRRGLFAGLIAASHEAGTREAGTGVGTPLAYHRPVIDSARCVACDACAGVCPDEAIIREHLPQHAYRIQPPRCTGCNLCVDLCDRKAITLEEPGAANEIVLKLDSGRCRSCGAPYYQLQESGSARSGLCRICSVRSHARNLFQVLGET